MKRSLPWWLVFIAIFQIVPPLLFPLDTLTGAAPWIWAPPVAIFALVGVGLLRGRVWARTATTFIQGFSVIVRLLSLLPGAVTVLSKADGTTIAHMPLITTGFISMALSTAILFSVDRPEVTATLR